MSAVRREQPPERRELGTESREPSICDHCGSTDLVWNKCKLVCRNCRQIVMSCADL